MRRSVRSGWPLPEVIAALALRPGENVADIGAGTGDFSAPIALAVLPAGVVYAIDVQIEMLSLLRTGWRAGRTSAGTHGSFRRRRLQKPHEGYSHASAKDLKLE